MWNGACDQQRGVCSKHDDGLGEVLDGRYAVLEQLDADYYRVFDLQALRVRKMIRRANGRLSPVEDDEVASAADYAGLEAELDKHDGGG